MLAEAGQPLSASTTYVLVELYATTIHVLMLSVRQWSVSALASWAKSLGWDWPPEAASRNIH